jgi:hypothetical protein
VFSRQLKVVAQRGGVLLWEGNPMRRSVKDLLKVPRVSLIQGNWLVV